MARKRAYHRTVAKRLRKSRSRGRHKGKREWERRTSDDDKSWASG